MSKKKNVTATDDTAALVPTDGDELDDATLAALGLGDSAEGGEVARLEDLQDYAIEHVTKLKQGRMLRGKFLGEGASIEIIDDKSGEVRTIRTWKIEVGPLKVARLIGSAGLDKHFLNVQPGGTCIVVRGPQVETNKGRRVNQFIVGWR